MPKARVVPIRLNKYRVGVGLGVSAAVLVAARVITTALSPSCASQPRSAWLSSYEISLRLLQRGYEVVRLHIGDDSCVDVVAKDKQGRFVDLQVNPFNAAIVRIGGT